MGLEVNLTQQGFSPQKASAYDIAETNAAKAQLSGLRSQISSVKNTITGLTQMLEADKPGCTTPHQFSWKEALMNIVQSNYFRDPKDRHADKRFTLFQATEHLDALQKEVEPLEEADLIFKTNKTIVKTEELLAKFEDEKNPTRNDRKRIDALRDQLDDLRTNRDTLLIKHAVRALHMHAQAAMPIEQILQGCDLSTPARTLCNTVDWITTPNMVAAGPSPLVLPGLEAANTTSLYADAPLSRVPNGTSVTVDGEPTQLPLQLWAAPQGAAPAPTTSNNPPTTITPPSAGAVADQQQRQRADRLIDEIITSMPERGYLPQDGNHDPVLALAVQTNDWPAYAKLEVLDAKGQHLATFGKQDGRTNQTITLQRRSNGEYVNAHDPHQSASNQEQLLTLLIQNQPRKSQLGRGGDFPGSDTTAGRIVNLRQQIADLAKAARPELFKAVVHSNCSQTDPGLPAVVKNRFMPLERSPTGTELMRKLHRENPHLTQARLTELLNTSPLSATEQYVYLESGRLPTAFALNKSRLEQAVQHELAVDAVYHTRTYNPQADALLRDAAAQELLKINRNLRIFERGQTFDSETAKAGDVIVRNYGNGVYRAYDVPNDQYIPVNADTDSLFRAIASVLQPHEHRAMGMTGEPDVRGFRQHMGRAIEQNPSLRPMATPGTQTPFATDLTQGLNKNGRGSVLHNKHGQSEGFTSVAHITTDQGSCTATLVDTYGDEGVKETPAILATAAHCVGTQEDSIDVGRSLSGRVEFGWFADTPVVSFRMNKVLFSSRRHNDIALIELKESVQSLMKAGITPTPLASHIPPNGTDIVTAGFPKILSPYFMHASACSNIDMGQYSISGGQTGYRDSVINHCLDVGPGSSGGPVMTADGKLFAVISGGHYQNQQLEYVITAPVAHLNECIVNGRFSFNGQNCELSPVFNITPDRHLSSYAKIKLDSSGNSILPSWNFAFETDSGFYRHKTVDDQAQCENPADYGQPVTTRFGELIDDPIGNKAGTHTLCIVGMDTPDQPLSKGLLRNAYSKSITLQAPSSPEKPGIHVQQTAEGYTVLGEQDPSKWRYTEMKYGVPGKINCEDESGYMSEAGWMFGHDALPVEVCNVGFDHAGDRSEPTKISLLAPSAAQAQSNANAS